MAIALGKRKRRAEATEPVRKAPAPPVEPESDNEDLQAIFRKAFEAKFKPLEVEKEKEPESVQEVEEGEEDSEQDSDWEGISEPEDAVEVIEHTFSQGPRERADKQALKAFMVGSNTLHAIHTMGDLTSHSPPSPLHSTSSPSPSRSRKPVTQRTTAPTPRTSRTT